MARPRKWTADQRAQALDVLESEGLAAAHQATGVPKPTILRWEAEAGPVRRTHPDQPIPAAGELVDVPARSGTKETEAATAERRRKLDAARENRAILLSAAASKALTRTLERLDDPDVALRDLVGVWTRAEHDLALITGHATEHAEIVVTFNVPPPSKTPPPVIPEDQLHALAP